MADSYLDIGVASGEVVFPFLPNWVSPPQSGFHVSRYFQHYKGGSASLDPMHAETPLAFEAQYLLENRESVYNFLQFIHSRVGRVNRFWVQYPKSFFDLKATSAYGSSVIVVDRNHFSLVYQGYERIYILMAGGDVLTRHIESITHDLANDTYNLHLASPLDRVLTVDNYVSIGRFLLVRFDHDLFRFTVETNEILSVGVKVYELVKEYEEIT